MFSSTDPIAHAESLIEKEQFDEALRFAKAMSKHLSKVVLRLNNVQANVHAKRFKVSSIREDYAAAQAAYREIQKLAELEPLAEPAVEERYLRAMMATRSKPMPVRRKYRHMALVEQLRRVYDLAGDIVECGCYRGLSSWMICATLNEEGGGFDGTGFHIFDSFAGLSAIAPEDELSADTADRERLAHMLKPGWFAYLEADVRRNLVAFPGIAYHPGWLPQSLVGEAERGYRFIHLDVDLYEPTLGALDYFYPRLVPGGVIFTDDYGWPGARQAFDEFSARNGLSVTALPTNQALLRNPR